MKPTSHALQAACPEVDPRLVEQHLARLGDRYFSLFSHAKIQEHLNCLARLSRAHPVEVLVDATPGDTAECTVFAFNHPGIFSLMTGVLTASGINILSGEVFTYARAESAPPPRRRGFGQRPRRASKDPFRRRRIVNHFSGRLDPVLSPSEWHQDVRHRLENVFGLVEQGDDVSMERARNRVNEMVVRHLARLQHDALPVLYPVSLEVDNSGQDFTRLKIVSEDTPAFLYALTHAFSLHDIRIEHVRIRTVHNRVEDEIDVVDLTHGKIEDPDALSRLKLSVLLTKQFTYFLAGAPDPYAALCRFKHFVGDILQHPGREDWIRTLSDPNALKDLARLLGTSDLLWEDFIRLQYESLLPVLQPLVKAPQGTADAETLAERLDQALEGAATEDEQCKRLNRFKDKEILSIDLDYILRVDVNFRTLSARLTSLAEVVFDRAARIARQHLEAAYGTPRTAAGLEAPFALFGLGKLGGRALGYASDIELLLVYGDNGTTDGARKIPNSEYFNRLMASLAGLIRAKREGIFQVDLRLRPHGNAGPLASSLESFCDYYGAGGAAHSYERLALVRLRAIAGDPALGARLERIRDEILYASDSIRIDDLRTLREKQFREKTLPGKRNAKFSPGALVDLEYNVQILQVIHGGLLPEVRTPQIQQALTALGNAGVLSAEETSQLFAAYDFLRLLINAMRMLRGSALDLFLPDEQAPEFAHLARRMGYGSGKPLGPAEQLRIDYETHTALVRAFAERHFGAQATPGGTAGTVADLILSDVFPEERATEILSTHGFRNTALAATNLKRLAGQGARRLAFARLSLLATDILSRTPSPDMALNNWERFIHSRTSPEFHYRLLMEQPMRMEILLRIFAGSQFLSDTLIRHPGYLDWIIMPENLHRIRSRKQLKEELLTPAPNPHDPTRWLNRMRRFRRREMLRVGTRDMVLGVPTENVTLELSLLAEALCETALGQVFGQLALEKSSPLPVEEISERFFVMAFGKLGGRELNYSSDIDLVGAFHVPQGDDTDTPTLKRLFATVMERLTKDLSQHSAQGYVYRVDLRLRPYGRAGELVPSLGTLLDYYRREASLWEIQAALKMRPVAGNRSLGYDFLRQLRPVLLQPRKRQDVVDSVERMRNAAIRKYGRSLAGGRDVKSGVGGIRDVEFLCQGLQLIHAADHPELLEGNTLSALDRLAKAGILPGNTVAELRDDYVFLRRVEHCLQILEDRQIHALPRDTAELDILAKRVLGVDTTAEAFLEAFHECSQRVRRAYETHLLQ